jgi:2-amino-4-hydroxy-6-hydroxymethyldihydropteridine diphosphokinase
MCPSAGHSTMPVSPSSARVAEVALIALGANLGDRAAYLSAARTALASIAGVRLLAATGVEETAPLGARLQPPYLNQMVAVLTTLGPIELLDQLQRIEHALGRRRLARWGSRTIDLDIVRMGERALCTPRLVLPHPGLSDRDFWRRESGRLDELLSAA